MFVLIILRNGQGESMRKTVFVLINIITFSSANLFTITDIKGNVLQSKNIQHIENAFLNQKASEYSMQAIYDELHKAEYLARKAAAARQRAERIANAQEAAKKVGETYHISALDKQKLLEDAKYFKGGRYIWGGTTPKGFDCSGYVQYLYKKHNVNLPRTAWAQSKKGEKIEKVVGNLPYYISIPLIRQIIELNKYLKLAVFLVQKEVGERLLAKAGSKDYGILSIAAQYYSQPKKIHTVAPTVFYPKPKVSSMIVKLDIYKKPFIKVSNERLFFNIIKASFYQRRKRLINSLSNYFKEEMDKLKIENILKEADIDKNRRGETLTLEEFAKLSRVWELL